MSGYPYGGYPPPQQNQIYPQIYNPANAPPPNQPMAMAYPGGQPAPTHYPYQPGFAYPMQSVPAPGQGIPQPTAMGYPNIAPTAPTAPTQQYGGYVGFPNVIPQQNPQWVPTTPRDAPALSDRAVVAGYESGDKSPLWVIRARFEGDLIPGKLAVKHHAAYVPWNGNENGVHNIEVLCAPPERVRWVHSNHGNVPPTAIPGGNTSSGETLYIGRAQIQDSLAPGKIHPSHKVLYISFNGEEVPHKSYEVLCTV